MQGVQTDLEAGRHCRGIFSLLNELAKHRDVIRISLAVGNMPSNTLAIVREKLTGPLATDHLRIWHAAPPPREPDDEANWQCEINDPIHAAFLASLQPDVILATIPYKNPLGGTCIPRGSLCENIPIAAIIDCSESDAISNSASDGPGMHQKAFVDGSGAEARIFAIFAICDPTDIGHPPAPYPPKFHAIPSVDSELPASAGMIVRTLLDEAGKESRHVSSRLCVEDTGIFTRHAPRILVIKMDHLGDFLLAIPALSKLRARYPYAVLDVVVGSWNIDVARKLNIFENVYSFDFFRRKSSATAAMDAEELAGLLSQLPQYDIAIDMRRQPDTRFFIARVKAELKVGYETLDASIDQLLDIALPMERDVAHRRTVLNETPISLQILRLVDCLPGSINDFVRLPELMPPQIRQVGTVAIFPKAGTDVREWGRAKFLDLIHRLDLSGSVKAVDVFFVSSSESTEFGIYSSKKVHVHIGLDFEALTKELSSSSLCIANNSGGVHLAAYLGVPVLGIYSGHETTLEWGPQFHGGVVMHRNAHCSPCHLGRLSDCQYGNFCLEDISVDDVHVKALEILAATPTESSTLPKWGPSPVSKQLNDDRIVKALISEIIPNLFSSHKDILLGVASAIAANHPTYRVPPESDTFGLNKTFKHNSSAIEWIGFSGSERSFRWTDGDRAVMLFDLGLEVEIGDEASVLLVFDTFRRQRLVAKFNGVPIFEGVRKGRRLLLDLPIRNLTRGTNRLEFQLPDAASPGSHDNRRLALAIRRFRVVGKGALAPGILRRPERIGEFLIRWR
jgi:ADP-heptose:LPS heptosyltransferase